MAKHNEVGQKGEEMAKAYLRKNGHKIIDTNWRFEHLEVDIISKIGEILVFTEVKTRTGSEWGKPEDAVTKSKQRFLGKAADEYIYKKEYNGDIRFDIISIEFSKEKGKEAEVIHFEDAFFPIG